MVGNPEISLFWRVILVGIWFVPMIVFLFERRFVRKLFLRDRAWMRKLSRLEQAVILSLLVIAVVHGSTKPSQPSFRANSPVRTGLESVSETSLSPEQLSAGFVLTEIKTDETHDFAAPPDAVIHERWLKRGAAEDVFSLAPANWSFPFGTNVFQKLFVASTGCIFFNHSPMFSSGSSLAPFCTSLGIVPEANWGKIHSETPLKSRFWHRLTPSNSLLLTWQNALLARDTNTPVSIQAELFPNGDFSFRYDLHAISNITEMPVFSIGAWNDGFGESFTNLARLVPTGTLVWKHLPPNATATSDDDDDGLSTADELFLYRTDPECVDTDCDGVPDGTELATRLDPLSRDTDGDGLVDGSDPAPAAATSLDDLDGDGLPDAYENHWFGSTNVIDSSSSFGAGGFSIGFSLSAGIIPTNAADSAYLSTNRVAAWKLTDAFFAVGDTPISATAIYERTFRIARNGGWEQFFLSSKPDCAGAWQLEGVAFEWEDSEGGSGSATASPSGDSLYMPVSTNSPATLTIRLRPTADTMSCRTPLYLLAFSPDIEVEGTESIATDNGIWNVATIANETSFPILIDRSERPCKAPLYRQEEAAQLPIDGALFIRDGLLHVNAPGIYQLPAIDLSASSATRLQASQPIARAGSRLSSPPPPATNTTYLAFLNPSISYGGGHHGNGFGLDFDASSGVYSATDDYPLDSACLWQSFHCDESGGFVCNCTPSLSLGFDLAMDEYPALATNIVLAGETATGTIAIGGTEVWSGSAMHDRSTDGGFTETKALYNDGCGDCGGCEDGNCDALEGAELGSLKFRIPLGVTRKGQISGFAWFKTDEPSAIGIDTLHVLSREDASVIDTTSGGVRTIVCSDNRGRTLAIASIENGIRITVTDTASGEPEHTWELTNVNASPSQIRLRKISRRNNTMSDETYVYADGDWTRFDNIAQFSEELVTTGDLNLDGSTRTERIVRDASGAVLSHTITQSERFGSFANATLRETFYAEKSWDDDNWNESFASYYTDNENPKRNGRLRLEWGNARAWRFNAYDTAGRTILTLDQYNGSECPVSSLSALPASSFNSADALAWLQAQSFTAIATLCDYTPLAGDDAATTDADEVRTESRYLVSGGTVTLIGRTWTRYTHGSENGCPTRTAESIRAASQSASIGDPDNAVSIETRYDADALGVPLLLRDTLVSATDENGIVTTNTYSISNAVIACSSRTSYQSNVSPIATHAERNTTYGNLLREWSVHTGSGIPFDEKQHLYDDKNRLRATLYADGSFVTNAYSCCRLLWSQDRTGRKTLRSAQTGTDHLYYAMEEVSLRCVSAFGQFRITQHFMDALGRETNTVVYAGTTPGEATIASASEGLEFSTETTTYPCGSSDYAINTDERGAVTIRRVDHLGNCIETVESVYTNDAEVVRTKSRSFFGGGISTRREWGNGKWSMTRQFADYAPDGKRLEYMITESVDCGTITNSVSSYDLLGRLIAKKVPGVNDSEILTVNSYDGASSRLLSSSTTGSPSVNYYYNEHGEHIGTSQDGKTIRNDTTYETINRQIYRVSIGTRMTGDVTNSIQVRKVQLSGLSDALRSRTISVAASGIETIRESSFDANSFVLTSVSQVGSATPITERSIFGMVLEQTSIDGLNGMAYDDFGRSIAIAMSDTTGTTYRFDFLEYDHSGNCVRQSTEFLDGRIAETSFEYNKLNRVVKRTDAMGNRIEMSYDPLDRMVSMSGDAYPILSDFDSVGRKTHGFTTRDNGATWDETQWEFDPASGVNTAKEYANGSRIAYSYTDNGMKTRTTWARGVWKQHAYNARNFVSGTTYSGTATPSVTYTYADSGKTASASLSDGTSYTYSYDDRLLNTNESVTIDGKAFSVNRTFDEFRRAQETEVLVTNVRHSVKVRLYDSENRVCGYALTNAAGRGVSVSLVYDGSYVTNTVYALPNGGSFSARLTREASRRDLVTRRDYFFGEQSIYWYSTEYDLLNRPTNATDSVSLVREWLYNRRSELAAATIGTNRYGYAYDTIGNRLWSAANAVTNSYTANSLNQYTAVSAGANPVYDADGNMTDDGTFAYSYDAENRLVSAYPVLPSVGSVAVENHYDHRHRRVQKDVKRYDGKAWETAESRTFVWDGNNIILEKVEFANGTTRTFEYFWGADKSGSEQGAGGVEGLLAVSMDGVFYMPCYDHNGNIVLYVSESGSIAAQYTYAPYGNITDSSGSLANVFSFGFSTKYYDREVNLIAYQRRFYRPDLGRWLNRDPIEEDGGENLYAFCANCPPLYYDYLGMDFWGCFFDAIQTAAGIATAVTGAGMMATAGWTGIGAAAGFALFTLGVDQATYGVYRAANRLMEKDLPTGTPIQCLYRAGAYQITKKHGSGLEESLDVAYFSANIVASCGTAYISASRCVTAVRSVHPPRTELHWGVGKNNTVEAVWEMNWGISIGKAGSVVATEAGSVLISVMGFFDDHGGENDGSDK